MNFKKFLLTHTANLKKHVRSPCCADITSLVIIITYSFNRHIANFIPSNIYIKMYIFISKTLGKSDVYLIILWRHFFIISDVHFHTLESPLIRHNNESRVAPSKGFPWPQPYKNRHIELVLLIRIIFTHSTLSGNTLLYNKIVLVKYANMYLHVMNKVEMSRCPPSRSIC